MCYLQHWVGLLFDGGMRETNGYANLQNTERYPNECDKDRKAKNYSHSIHSSTWIWMASTVGVWMCRLRWCANECTRAVLSFTKSMWNTTRIMNNIFEYVYVCARWFSIVNGYESNNRPTVVCAYEQCRKKINRKRHLWYLNVFI